MLTVSRLDRPLASCKNRKNPTKQGLNYPVASRHDVSLSARRQRYAGIDTPRYGEKVKHGNL